MYDELLVAGYQCKTENYSDMIIDLRKIDVETKCKQKIH